MAREEAAQSAVASTEKPKSVKKPKRLSLSELPTKALRDALRVPQAIVDEYASDPTAPHDIAVALDMSPTSSSWRDLAAVSMGYGLTKGSWNAKSISLEELGRRAVAPTEEGDEIRARAEAALRPKVYAGFFRKYNKAKFPQDHIAKNVLRQEFGVPEDRLDLALQILKDNGQFVGFIRDTKTGPFVVVDDPQPRPVRLPPEEPGDEERPEANAEEHNDETEIAGSRPERSTPAAPDSLRVFITHGKNVGIVDQVKDILSLYDIEYEVAVEEETAAIPVPAKVMSAMRRCNAGVMVVTADQQSATDGGYHINTNVLIEIGAAFVLYDQGVVLLWDKRLKVPSNLQGLYRIEFEGDELSFAAGTKLAKGVKSLRK